MPTESSINKMPEGKSEVTLKLLNKYNKKELKALCSEHGLATFGTRTALFDRLKNFFDLEPGEDDKEKDVEDEVTKDDEEEVVEEDDKKKGSKKDQKDKSKYELPETEEEQGSTSVEKSDFDKEKEQVFNKLYKLNLARDSKENLDKVLRNYDSLMKEHPDNDYILINKGLCLQYLQDYNGAVECYINALKANPDNIEARMLLEGCRVLGVVETKLLETVEPDLKSEISIKAKVEKADVQTKEIDERRADEFTKLRARVPSISKDAKTTKPTGEDKEPLIRLKGTEKVSDKIHISGTQTSGNGHKSLLGDDFGSIDTKVLTASKSKLTSVLDELKSELHKPAEDKRTEKSGEGPSGSGHGVIKELDMEKQSLRKMLDSKKSDDDFGSRVLDSARKLLAVSETLDSSTATLDKKITENGELTEAGKEVSKKTDLEVDGESKIKQEPEPDSKPDLESKPKRKRPTERIRNRTGNISFDKLTQGGLLSASNILIDGPPFVGKEILLYKFASLGFKMNVPCIIVNPETAPGTIRDVFNSILGDIKEFEDKSLLYWLDPELDEVKEKFKRKEAGEFPDLHQLLLDGLEAYSDEIFEKYDSYNLIFFSMTPIIMFQEPKIINRFLSRFSKKIKDDNVIAMYTIDNTMHERQDLNFVRRVMEGIVEIKQEDARADHANPRNLLKLDKLPYAGSYDWHEYKYDEKNFEIKEIHKYKREG